MAVAKVDVDDDDSMLDRRGSPRLGPSISLVVFLGTLLTHLQTGSNGANLSFPAEFGIGSNSAHDKLLVGLINSVPPLAMICLQVAT